MAKRNNLQVRCPESDSRAYVHDNEESPHIAGLRQRARGRGSVPAGRRAGSFTKVGFARLFSSAGARSIRRSVRSTTPLWTAKLAGEWTEARDFFKGVEFGLRKKMSAALYLVSGRSLFRESETSGSSSQSATINGTESFTAARAPTKTTRVAHCQSRGGVVEIMNAL